MGKVERGESYHLLILLLLWTVYQARAELSGTLPPWQNSQQSCACCGGFQHLRILRCSLTGVATMTYITPKQIWFNVLIVGLTQCGLVVPWCLIDLVQLGSGKGLWPVQHQAIIYTNADLLSVGSSGTNFSEIWIKVKEFSFKKMG